MGEARDIIECFLKAVADTCPSFTEDMAVQLERQFRNDWGGVENKPAKRAPYMRKAREKVREQVGTKPDKEIIEEHGISRRTLYRWIKK